MTDFADAASEVAAGSPTRSDAEVTTTAALSIDRSCQPDTRVVHAGAGSGRAARELRLGPAALAGRAKHGDDFTKPAACPVDVRTGWRQIDRVHLQLTHHAQDTLSEGSHRWRPRPTLVSRSARLPL